MGLVIEDAREAAAHVADALKRRGQDAYGAVSNVAGRASRVGLLEDNWPQLALAGAVGFVAGLAALSARKAATQAVSTLSGDWFDALKAEHKLVDRLFALACATKDREAAKRTALLAKIAYALSKHALQEENVVYPVVRDTDQGVASKVLAAEHFDMKTYLHELDRMAKDDPRWLGKLKAFRKLVKEHVREEEEHVFPALRDRLSSAENAHLTRCMLREGAKLA
jgi:hemerythrin superfamily protein